MKPATPVTLDKKDRLEKIAASFSELAVLVQDNQDMERLLKQRDDVEIPPSELPHHLIQFLSEELRNCTNWIWGKERRNEKTN